MRHPNNSSTLTWVMLNQHDAADGWDGVQPAGEPGQRASQVAPVVFLLGYLAARRRGAAEKVKRTVAIPWFLLGFLAMIGVNSLGVLSATWTTRLLTVNQFLLAAALAAMGLETSVRKLKAAGLRPFLLGSGAWCFISILSLGLIRIFYW